MTQNDRSRRDGHMMALGMVSVGFNNLEGALRYLICILADIPLHQGLLAIRHLSFSSVTRTLKDIAEKHLASDREKRDRVLSLSKRSATVAKQRNVMLHSSWGWIGKKAVRYTHFDASTKETSDDELLEIASRISDLTDEAIAIMYPTQPQPEPDPS